MTHLQIERELSEAIDGTMRQTSLHNETRLAIVRAVQLPLVFLIILIFNSDPRTLTLSAAWAAVSWFSFGLLREKTWQPRFGWFFTILDGTMVLSFALQHAAYGGPQYQRLMAVSMASICTMYGLTGALRLRPAMVWASAIFAAANFAVVAYVTNASLTEIVFVTSLLLIAGVMAISLIEVGRRSLADQVRSVIVRRFLPDTVVNAGNEVPLPAIVEPKQVDATIIITDIRGFTSYAEGVTPKEAMEFLNEFQGKLADVVRRHGGVVDKFLGDGMLAVFSDGVHAERALAAASEILLVTEGTHIGVGVHSGPVVTGVIGNGSRLEFTVIGDTVNIASRLESMTKTQGVSMLVSADTVQRIEIKPALSEIGEVAIRGREKRLAVFAPTERG